MLRDAPLRRELPAHHSVAFHVHHLRVARRFTCHFEKGGGIEPKALGQHNAFGQSEPIESENEVDGEIGPAPVAHLSDMELDRKERTQD